MKETRLIKNSRLMPAAKVAQMGFKGLMSNKAIVIPGLLNKILAFGSQIGPRVLVTAISRWTLEK
jgi:short-subunit dehydrogenase